jgi:hypothetical protein
MEIEGVKGVWLVLDGKYSSEIALDLNEEIKDKLDQVVSYCQEIVKSEKLFLGCKAEFDLFMIEVLNNRQYIVIWASDKVDTSILKMELDIIIEENLKNNDSFIKKFKFW